MSIQKFFPVFLIYLWVQPFLSAQVDTLFTDPADTKVEQQKMVEAYHRSPNRVGAKFDEYVWTVDFAKCHTGRRTAMRYFLEKNWKYFRDTALAKGFICAYRVLETNPDSLGNFDFILMTAYPDSAGWARREARFGPVMKVLRPGGPLMPDGLKRSDVVQSIFYKDSRTVFSAESRTMPKIHIPGKPDNVERLKAINRDIWTPFSEAYAANDAEKYLALHTPDFIRANGGEWAGTHNLTDYGKGVRTSFAARQDRGDKVQIDFSFFERAAGPETASERGIYRLISTKKDGARQVFYGKFQVFHRLTAGVWKIAVDYDSNEDNSIDEADFNNGFSLNVFTKN